MSSTYRGPESLASMQYSFQSLLEQVMENSTGRGFFTRPVVLLKKSDCVSHDGKILMPTTIDMAKIKKPNTGQYNRGVQFSKSMPEEMVKKTLQEAFPSFNLTGSQGSTALIFHGNHGVWNGKMINKTVRGNSVLYILLEDDQVPQESPHVANDAFTNSALVALHHLNQPTFTSTSKSATIMTEHNMQPCNDFQVQGSSIPPRPSGASTNFNVTNPQEITATVAFSNINQPSLGESSATVMVQNNMQPWNAFQLPECTIPSESLEALASNPNFSTPEPQNAAPADRGLDFTTMMVDEWLEMPGFFDHTMTDDNDHTGTSEISNLQPPEQGFLLNSPEMSDSSADHSNTTSGISELGHNLSLDDTLPPEEEHFEFSVTPQRVPLLGGDLCCFQSDRAFPRNVQSALAVFEHLDTVNVKRCGDDSLVGKKIPQRSAAMASRKAKSLVFRSPAGVRVAAIRDVIEKDLGSGGVTVVQELQSGEYLIELQNKDQAEQLISDGFGINDLHVQPSPPQGQFTNVSIMSLRAYIEDTSIIKELEKFGEIKSEVIRLKYKKGHDLAGVENGNRLLRMVLTKPSVPYSLKIEGEWCRVIHTNQKPICSLCHEDGHRRNECPTVVCFTCNETGHVRENCPNRPTDNTTPTATEIDEEERRMHTEKLLRQEAETDRVLRDRHKQPDLVYAEELDEEFFDAENDPEDPTDDPDMEQDQATSHHNNQKKKDLHKPGTKGLNTSSDEDRVKTRRQRLKPTPKLEGTRSKTNEKQQEPATGEDNSEHSQQEQY
ncbi:hypothetical protein AWC38_SpisGene6394 [Stylophora pistillata]|uniref:CCHC-type domain-containing protein n=1 Tax=Stylophora pistillata TaxID=50429 RepID=A0A2B4SK37_STYPI|nr:hypothetical protein AWC38_SpisGene6394 [Stylophora pistillata]